MAVFQDRWIRNTKDNRGLEMEAHQMDLLAVRMLRRDKQALGRIAKSEGESVATVVRRLVSDFIRSMEDAATVVSYRGAAITKNDEREHKRQTVPGEIIPLYSPFPLEMLDEAL